MHERNWSKPHSLGAGLLAIRAQWDLLLGSREYFDCGKYFGGGVPPQPGAAGMGVHCFSAGLRVVSNAWRMAGGSVRPTASPYRWGRLVGNLHGVDGVVADQSSGRRTFFYTRALSTRRRRGHHLPRFEPVRLSVDPFARTRHSQRNDLRGRWSRSRNRSDFCKLCHGPLRLALIFLDKRAPWIARG